MNKKNRIAMVIHVLNIGGAGKVVVNLAQGFIKKGYEVDIVFIHRKGGLLSILSPEVNLYELLPDRRKLKLWILNKINTFLYPDLILKKVQYIAIYLTGILICNKKLKMLGRYNICAIELTKYIKKRKPDVMLPFLLKTCIISVLARKISKQKCHLIIDEQNIPISMLSVYKKSTSKILINFIKALYPETDGMIVSSQKIADEIKILTEKVKDIYVIHNPVIDTEVFENYCREEITHPWIKSRQYPVILSAGRLAPEKDFKTLLKATAIVCKTKEVRLIILGDGKEKENMKRTVDELHIGDKVDIIGFVMNPYPYMKNASVFVLSSKNEGFGNVLVEAMACGCPIVSTDCPGGPAEILDNGRYGKLVPVGNDKALADAILETLDKPLPAEILKKRGMEFSVDKITGEYLKVLFP